MKTTVDFTKMNAEQIEIFMEHCIAAMTLCQEDNDILVHDVFVDLYNGAEAEFIEKDYPSA